MKRFTYNTKKISGDVNSTVMIAMLLALTYFAFLTVISENTETVFAISDLPNGKSERIVQQGIVTSTPDPLPGHESHQSITILRMKANNPVYEGTLSFIASKPVEVQILSRNMTSDDNAAPKIPASFGSMNIIPLSGGQGQVISSLIVPPYPEDATSFSASLPFAGNGLALHNVDGDKFVASYTVVAKILDKADRADEISIADEASDEDKDQDEDNNDDNDNDNDKNKND